MALRLATKLHAVSPQDGTHRRAVDSELRPHLVDGLAGAVGSDHAPLIIASPRTADFWNIGGGEFV